MRRLRVFRWSRGTPRASLRWVAAAGSVALLTALAPPGPTTAFCGRSAACASSKAARQVCGLRCVGAPSAVASADVDADFWQSPLGRVREQFQMTHQLKVRKGRRRLPPWTDSAIVVPHQLKRDIEQLEYIVARQVLDPHVQELVSDVVLPEFHALSAAVDDKIAKGDKTFVEMRFSKEFGSFFALHSRAIHLHPGDAVPGEAIRPRDFDSLQREFLQQEHRAMCIDDFFSQEALQQLRDFLLESTFWFDAKTGYVGTYLTTAFASPLTAQIDRELRSKLPQLLGGLELQNAWAFMYDGSLGGVNTHADDAQVQINFFITPTEANLWSEDDSNPPGGLVVFGIGPPKEWAFTDFNSEGDKPRVEELIASTGGWKLTVPYVENRAVLFDSTYFHRTDDMKFRKGYKNRRINVTFLYGKRKNLVEAPTVRAQ
mmetsp:Transcript_1566/g.3515  ORF Transcript_1566/g.3515 Transcript_1566/m.3515 type:complete len:430 (-) Transcript_1566:60-1349(-)